MKYLGAASILFAWLAIAFVTINIPRELSKSISHHATQKQFRYRIFTLLMSLSLAFMLAFMLGWLIPTLQLPIGFTFLMLVVVVLEMIATFVPLTTGWRRTVHELTSYGAAMLVPGLLLWMLFSPTISTYASIMSTIAIIAMISFFGLFFFVKASHKHHLIYQSAYIALFHFALISLIVFQG